VTREELAIQLGLDPAKIWSLCVAPLVARSRLDRLLWAIDQLGVVRRDVEHVLIGSGPQLHQLHRRARVQHLADRLRIMPSCECLPDLLREVRLVWQSGEVALGGGLFDAMAAGKPTVAVDSEAVRQAIVDGETGWIVPPLPESEFPRRAFSLVEDDAVAFRFGAAAQERAAMHFSADRFISALLAAIK
jgi:glycosyltransferase involved in cell wall biosynthesis